MDSLWGMYDDDRNGLLDKEECNKFVKQLYYENGMDWDEQKYEKIYKEIDADGNQNINKAEMY